MRAKPVITEEERPALFAFLGLSALFGLGAAVGGAALFLEEPPTPASLTLSLLQQETDGVPDAAE